MPSRRPTPYIRPYARKPRIDSGSGDSLIGGAPIGLAGTGGRPRGVRRRLGALWTRSDRGQPDRRARRSRGLADAASDPLSMEMSTSRIRDSNPPPRSTQWTPNSLLADTQDVIGRAERGLRVADDEQRRHQPSVSRDCHRCLDRGLRRATPPWCHISLIVLATYVMDHQSAPADGAPQLVARASARRFGSSVRCSGSPPTARRISSGGKRPYRAVRAALVEDVGIRNSCGFDSGHVVERRA